MTTRPWLKWYPGDWRADPLLRSCEPISRYVWMEMIGLMHEAEPYGHLVLAGRAMDYKTLSRVIGVDAGEVKRAVKELEDRGVFTRTNGGVIFSRRMVRDESRRKTLQENGSKGGNPKLINQEVSGGLDNQTPNQSDKPQRPEARGSVANATGASADPAKQMFDLGVHLLTETGCTDKQARSLLGKWRKATSDGEVLTALMDCRARTISNPVEWLERRFGGASEYVSKSGYRYRGSLEDVIRESERRGDMDIHWRAKGDLKRKQAA